MSIEYLELALGPAVAKELWTSAYRPVLPVTPQDFSLGAVLPAILYMMRWGERRGMGKFSAVFGPAATIHTVSAILAQNPAFQNFNSETSRVILGDLLLAFCLENKKHEEGHTTPVVRVFPTHYFSSWVDLPDKVAHLRAIPELITAILVDQEKGNLLEPTSTGRGFYSIYSGFESNNVGDSPNLLLKVFGRGVVTSGDKKSDRRLADRFSEEVDLSIDQILMVRLAQVLGEAPLPIRATKVDSQKIPNQRPLSVTATETFRKDISILLRTYAEHAPRASLVAMLESAFAIGLTNVYLSVFKNLTFWEQNYSVPEVKDESPWPLFIDCSGGVDSTIRNYAEASFDDLQRRHVRLPEILMCMKVLERAAKDAQVTLPPSEPDPTARINVLGDLISEKTIDGEEVTRELRRQRVRLTEVLRDNGEEQYANQLEKDPRHHAWCIAEMIVRLMGDKYQIHHFRKFLSSCTNGDEPTGIARREKRLIRGKWTDRQSICLSNSALDFLVHRHLVKENKSRLMARVSIKDFLDILKNSYGLFIEDSPPGLSVSTEVLLANRLHLERRLRDLGLLRGVNDAESMKLLKPRFKS